MVGKIPKNNPIKAYTQVSVNAESTGTKMIHCVETQHGLDTAIYFCMLDAP